MEDKEKTDKHHLPEEISASFLAEQSAQMASKIYFEPLYLLLIIMFSIFAGETLITLVLTNLLSSPVYYGSLLDPLILIIIVFPILYFFSFKPLRSYITELKQMGETIARCEEQYRSLVESTDDSIYLINKECHFLFMNKKHLSRMGLSEDQVLGRSYGEFHSPGETKEFVEKIAEVFKIRNSVRHKHKSRRDNRYFLRTFSPVKNSYGEVEAVTVISKDVSELENM